MCDASETTCHINSYLFIHVVPLHLMSLYSSAPTDKSCAQSTFQHPSESYTYLWQLVLPFPIVFSAFFLSSGQLKWTAHKQLGTFFKLQLKIKTSSLDFKDFLCLNSQVWRSMSSFHSHQLQAWKC